MKKILLLLVLSFNMTLLPFSSGGSAQRTRFLRELGDWTTTVQQLNKNFANTSIVQFTGALDGFDTFEKSFSGAQKSPIDQQKLTDIRNALNELISRKNRDMGH